ncbi:MAG: hypothetical protein ABR555_10000 [Pyrinomonadaceae bacterium]
MDLTRSPCCLHLCFSDAAACPQCGQVFELHELDRKAMSEEKAFAKKANEVFLGIFLAWFALLAFIK